MEAAERHAELELSEHLQRLYRIRAVGTSGFTGTSGARILYPSYHDGAPYDYVVEAELTSAAKTLPITCNGDPSEYHQEIYLETYQQSTASLFAYAGSRSEGSSRQETWNLTGSDPFDWKIAYAAP